MTRRDLQHDGAVMEKMGTGATTRLTVMIVPALTGGRLAPDRLAEGYGSSLSLAYPADA